MISRKTLICFLSRKGRIVLQILWEIENPQKSCNALLTNADESRQEQRVASSRARRRQPLLSFGGPGKEAITPSVSWVCGGSLKTNAARGAATEMKLSNS